MKKEKPQGKTKRQHFVPRFYLRHFTNTKGKLQAYRIDTDSYFVAAPEGVCAENYLYEVKRLGFDEVDGNPEFLHNYIESRLSDLESELAPQYNQLISCCERHDFESDAFDEGRLAACALATNLMVRHPRFLEDDRLDASKLTKTFLATNKLTEDVWRMVLKIAIGGDDPDALSEVAIMKALLFSEYPEVPSSRIYGAFTNKRITIVQAPVGMDFITTSMPFDFGGIDEDAYDFRVAYMPLSSKYAAFFTIYEHSSRFVEASMEEAVRCNTAILSHNSFWNTAMTGAKGSLEIAVRRWKELIEAQ